MSGARLSDLDLIGLAFLFIGVWFVVSVVLAVVVDYVQYPQLYSLPDFCEWCRVNEGIRCCSQASCMHCCRAYEEHFNLTLPCEKWCPPEDGFPVLDLTDVAIMVVSAVISLGIVWLVAKYLLSRGVDNGSDSQMGKGRVA